ncbi:hypothetical protein GGX14DRAFT_466600, partial [Mycena pura]
KLVGVLAYLVLTICVVEMIMSVNEQYSRVAGFPVYPPFGISPKHKFSEASNYHLKLSKHAYRHFIPRKSLTTALCVRAQGQRY